MIHYIDSAVDGVDMLSRCSQTIFEEPFRRLRFKLSNLKTFVLCAKELGSDANLTSLLARIEDTVRRNADQIHRHFESGGLQKGMASNFEAEIESLNDDIDVLYASMLERCPKITSIDGVLGIITSIIDGFVDLRRWIETPHGDRVPFLLHTFQAFEQQMSSMKSLIRFVSMRSVDELETLLDFSAHTLTVATRASYVIFTSRLGSNCYLYPQECEQLQSEISVLVERMKPIDSDVYGAYTRALGGSKLQRPSLLDSVAMEGFVESLISNLWDILRQNCYIVSGKDLQQVYGGLRSIRAIFKHRQGENKLKEDIWDFLCDAAVFICSLHHRHGEEEELVSKNLLGKIKSILVHFEGAREEEVEVEAKQTGVKKVSDTHRNQIPSQGEGSTSMKNEQVVVGFLDEQTLLVDQLTRGSQNLQIAAIVGMPGLGKTTLATAVFTSTSVSFHFHVRAWITVSQVVNKRKILLALLNQIDPSRCLELDLADGLRKSLKGRRYLIFLDDVWETSAWNLLKESFPDDKNGSRIILTSRRHDVVSHGLMVDQKPLYLRELNQEESMELLQRKMYATLSLDISMKIAEKCGGLPLMLVIVAGVLKNTEPEGWDEMLDGLRDVSTDMECRDTLDLSYQHIPAHLRPCLLYFGAFRDDEEVSVRRLVRLWIAEGLVEKADGKKSMEDVAEGYLNDLIGRSLIMVAKQRYDGGVKTCRIHDLLHDFCIQKAKDEHFFHFLSGYDELSEFNEQLNLQRLIIHSEAEDFKRSKLFCPLARSLLFNFSGSQSVTVAISSAIQVFKLLTVLDLEQVGLGCRFPTEIEQLVQLAFLAIQCNAGGVLSLISNLSKLQTFIMKGGRWQISIPESFWNLQKLQYFYLECWTSKHSYQGGGTLAHFDPESISSSILHMLERLSGVVIPLSELEGVLKKLPSIRKLKFILPYSRDDGSNMVIPDISSRLESLHILSVAHKLHFDAYSWPAHLKKLTLVKFSLSRRNLSTMGEMQDLEALKLVHVKFEDNAWEMKEGEFPKLKFLKLDNSRLVRWFTDCDDQLECFQKLVLKQCFSLEELPFCLEEIPTLEVIEVTVCPDRVVDVVNRVGERRQDQTGDSSLKIIISNIM